MDSTTTLDAASETRVLPAGLSVVVPCYDSEATLGELTRRLAVVLPRLVERFELILVNDGSSDRTWETIEQIGLRSTPV